MNKKMTPKTGLILLMAGILFQVSAVFADIYHHVMEERMALGDFLFGDEGIFSPQHVLLPIGLTIVVAGTIFLVCAGKK